MWKGPKAGERLTLKNSNQLGMTGTWGLHSDGGNEQKMVRNKTREKSMIMMGLKHYDNSSVHFSSVQSSHSVVSDSVTPWMAACQAFLSITNSRSLLKLMSIESVRWCHPTISSSVIPFSSCPQSLPASGSSPVSQLFAWGGQSIGVSASASVLPQDWSPLGWTGWISLQSKGLSRVFSNTKVQKHQFLSAQPPSQSNSHIHTWPLEKP